MLARSRFISSDIFVGPTCTCQWGSRALDRANGGKARVGLSGLRRVSGVAKAGEPQPPQVESVNNDGDIPVLSASAYLLAEAEREEGTSATTPNPPASRVKPPIVISEDAWDGDEPQARAIRRILEDQYKPLRIKGYKKKIPIPTPLPSILFRPSESDPSASISSTSTSSIDAPPVTPRNPWEYTFKTPASHSSTPRFSADLIPLPSRITSSPSGINRRIPTPTRIARAMEKSLDYNSGFGAPTRVLVPEFEGQEGGRTGMGGMRAWNGIVEEKIEQARRDGLFDVNKGRGKPIPRDEAEANPFISRDDFLINRVVAGQGAAPAWVELQQELDSAVSTFRSELRHSWARRAIRMKSVGGLSRAAITEIKEGWRDAEWEARERAFHIASVDSLNSIMRRYNGVAPYAVRRAPLMFKVELESCITNSIPFITKELQRRLDGGGTTVKLSPSKPKIDREIVGRTVGEEGEQKAVDESMWKAFRRVIVEVLGNTGSPPNAIK